MLNSKSNNTKLIMETWRRFLNEESGEELTNDELDSAIKKIASTIQVESINEGDKRFDPAEFSLVIILLTFIAAGIAMPAAVKQEANNKLNIAEIQEIRNQLTSQDGVACTPDSVDIAKKLLKKTTAIQRFWLLRALLGGLLEASWGVLTAPWAVWRPSEAGWIALGPFGPC